jgi:multidrug efflux pump subunit AcrA (membrane-fusion protein)
MAIHKDGIVAKLQAADHTVEIRSPITGRLRELRAQIGQNIAAGDAIATIDPAGEQVWEALRALYLVGQSEDLAAVSPYERELPDIPDHVRQQAVETERAIRERAK